MTETRPNPQLTRAMPRGIVKGITVGIVAMVLAFLPKCAESLVV